MAPRRYNAFNPPPPSIEYNSGVRVVVDDLSMTVQDIIQAALEGDLNFPMLTEDTSGSVFDLRETSLMDSLPFAHELYGPESESDNFDEHLNNISDESPQSNHQVVDLPSPGSPTDTAQESE